MRYLLTVLALGISLFYAPVADACSVSGLTLTPGNNNYSFSASSCATNSSFDVTLKYKNASGTVVANQTQTKDAAGSYSFPSSMSPTGTGTFTAILTITPKHYRLQCKGSPTRCANQAQLEYDLCRRNGGGGRISSAGGPVSGIAMMLPIDQCQTTYSQRIQQCNSLCSAYDSNGYRTYASQSISKSYTPFYDNSTVGNVPTKSNPRTINLFPESTDVNVNTSSYGSYYIRAQIKNSSGTILATKASNIVAASGSTVNLAGQSYTVPSYGTYTVVQRLYRDNGSNDTLLHTKNTSLTFSCPAMGFYSAYNKDGDVSDGSVGLTSRPRVASCHGSATLAITVKNSSGATVHTSTKSVSRSTTDVSTAARALNFGSLADGTYSVFQKLSKSGHTTKSRTDTLTVSFYDDSTITTTPSTSATRKINLFAHSSDVGFDASSNGSYYIKAQIKNSSGTVISTQTSATVGNSGASVALPTKVYTVPAYGSYSVVQRLYREAGSTDTLVDTKTTTGLNFGCPAMAFYSAYNKDTDVTDGSVGLTSRPRVASCHGSANLAINVKNSSGTSVYTTNVAVSTSSTEVTHVPKVLNFGDLPGGNYTVTQTLTKSGHSTKTRNDSLNVDFFDESTITTTPTASATRKINLFPNSSDVAFNASNNGSYYIKAQIKNSSGTVISTQTSATVGNSGASVSLPVKTYTTPAYGSYSVVQRLYREAGATDTLVDTKTTTGLNFACPAMEFYGATAKDSDVSDGSVGLTSRPRVASCHGSANLSINVKNSSGTSVYTTNVSVSSTTLEPSTQARVLQFGDLADGTYTVTQTLTKSGHSTKTRNDTLIVDFYDDSTITSTPTTAATRKINLFPNSTDVAFNASSPGSYYIKAKVKNSAGTVITTQTSATVVNTANTVSLPTKIYTVPGYGTYSVVQQLYRESGTTDSLVDTKTTSNLSFGCPTMAILAADNKDVDVTDGSVGLRARPRLASCHGTATLAINVKNASGTSVFSTTKSVSTSTVELSTDPTVLDFGALSNGTYTVHQTVSSSGHDSRSRTDTLVVEFYDNSTITSTPTTSAPRTLHLFPNASDVSFDASSDGTYYIKATIKDSSGTTVATKTSTTVANASGGVPLPAIEYSAPEYETYSVTQQLYREQGSTDLLVDSKTTTGLSFACPAMTFLAADSKDTDVSDGSVGLRSRPRVASCHGTVALDINVKNDSGVSVFTDSLSLSASSVEISTVAKVLDFGDLEDGTYTVNQTLTASGHANQSRQDSLIVEQFDNTTIATVPLAQSGRLLKLFSQSADVAFDASSGASYYIKAEVKNASGTVIASELSTTVANAGSTVSLPTKDYTVPAYGTYSVTQTLYREQGATDPVVDTRTTTELVFGCPALALLEATFKDGDVSDGSVGLRSRPRVASCHGDVTLSIDVENSAGTSVYSENISLSSGTVELTTKPQTLDFGSLDDGTYTVIQTLTADGHTSQSRNDTLVVEYYDVSKIVTVPTTSSVRTIDLFNETVDIDVNASSDGTYYIQYKVKDSQGNLVTSQTSTTTANAGDSVDLPSAQYTVPDYDVYSVEQELYRESGTTDILVDSTVTNDLSFACPVPTISSLVSTDVDGLDGNHGFTVRPHHAQCHSDVTLDVVIKDASDTVVLTLPEASLTTSSVELALNAQEFSFDALSGGSYSVEQTLSGTNFDDVLRNDTFEIVCEDASLNGLFQIDTDGSDGNHGFTVNTKLSSCNAPSKLTLEVKNSGGTTVFNSPEYSLSTSAVTLQTVTQPVGFPVLPPGTYSVSQELTTSRGQILTRNDSLELTCNEFTAEWGSPSSAESPQDSFTINAQVSSTDECNGQISSNLLITDGSNTVFNSTSKVAQSGASPIPAWQWTFDEAGLDDTTLDITLTLTNEYGLEKVLTDQLEVTCPTLFTPTNFNYDADTEQFSLDVAGGRACNGSGTIDLEIRNPASNNESIGSNSATIDLSGNTTTFVYDLPATFPNNPVGTYSIYGELTDAKGAIVPFTYFYTYESDNTESCSIDAINPFNFGELINFTYQVSGCSSAVSYRSELVIKDDQGTVLSTTNKPDINPGQISYNPSLMPTANGVYTGQLTVFAEESVPSCAPTNCEIQAQVMYDFCIEQPRNERFPRDCQAEKEQFLTQCSADCEASGGNNIAVDQMTVTSQHLVYDDSSKIVTEPVGDGLTLYLFRDDVDVNVITSSYGDYTLRATIYSPSDEQLAVIEQGPTTATSAELNYTEDSFEVADYGSYRIRQELRRDDELIDTREDIVVLECLDPQLLGLGNIDLNAIDSFINFDHAVNSAQCNGAMELNLSIKNDQGVVVYQTPSAIDLAPSTQLVQSQESVQHVTFTLPVLPRGTYQVRTDLNDSGSITHTRTDMLEVACEVFQGGLGDPAIIEPEDDNFVFRGHVYAADTCNGMLDVNVLLKDGETELVALPEQSFRSDQVPLNIDHPFELALDGTTVDVIMSVENIFGDIETYTQQVEVNCPAKFNFVSFSYDQLSSDFSLQLDQLRACNGIGTIDYQVLDLSDNNRVINQTSASIDLTGSSNGFTQHTPLDLPANDVVGNYKVVGTVTDANGESKPFEYNFELICPPWEFQGATVGSPTPTLLQLDDEPGNVSLDAYVAKTDVCHTVFDPDNAELLVTDPESGTEYPMATPAVIAPLSETDNVRLTFTPQIEELDFFGKQHDFDFTLTEPTGVLAHEYQGHLQVACPIFGLDVTGNFRLYGRHKTSVSRDPRLACQEELTLTWQGTYYDAQSETFSTVATSEPIPKSTGDTFESEIIWAPEASDLGGRRIIMEPYIQFFTPYEITKQSEDLTQDYILPCQPAEMTDVHSVEQNRSKNTLTFTATYTPSMTCNGHTSIIATIKDDEGNEIVSTTSYVDSEEPTDVEFETQYVPQGLYDIEFNLYDTAGNNTVNELTIATPCSTPGIVGTYRGELSKSVNQYLMIDVPSCLGEAEEVNVSFENPLTQQTEALTASRVNPDNQDNFFIAEMGDYGFVGMHELAMQVAAGEVTYDETVRARFYPPLNSTPMVNQVPYEPENVLQTVKGFDNVYVNFDSNYALAQKLAITGYVPEYPETDQVEVVNLTNDSQAGSIDLTFTLYDLENKDIPIDIELYFDSSADDSNYKMECRKVVDLDMMAQLQSSGYQFPEPSQTLLNSFRCMAHLDTVEADYTAQKIVVRRKGGQTFELPKPATLNGFTSLAAGGIVPPTIANMIAITDVESNKSYGALLVKHRSILKPVPVTPLPSGTYTAHFNPLLDYDVAQRSHSISFEYEQPVSDLALKMPVGVDLEVDAAIPNSDTATYKQLHNNLDVEVEISQISGSGNYTFNGQTVSDTPVQTTISKASYLNLTFKLLVKSIGEPEPAVFKIKPLTTTVIKPIDLTIEPMVATYELANLREQYFIGDPTVKIYAEPTDGSDCQYIAGGDIGLNSTYSVPTCAFRWDIEGYESLRTASSGSVLRGQFSESSTSIPYEFGIAYTSPEDHETRFYPLDSATLEPNLVPPGMIDITPRRSNVVSRLGEGFYTFVGKYVPASIDVTGDVPGLSINYNLDGEQFEKESSSTRERFRLFTETERVYESVPFSINVDYHDHSTGTNSMDIDFVSVPSGLTAMIEQPEPTITGESVELVARLLYYTANGKQPFNKLTSGEWDIQLYEMEGRDATPIGDPVPLQDDGTASFTVTEENPGVKRYYFEAVAKPPQGIDFAMTLQSRSVRLMVADGSAIIGNIISTSPSGSIPFAGTVIYVPDNYRRAYDLARIDWYRSTDGVDYQLVPEFTERKLPYEIETSGDTYYKAISYNKHSGEQFESEPIVVKGYKVPIIQVTGDTTTFIEHPGQLTVETLNGIDTEYEWEYKWGRYGETVTATGEQITLDAESPGVYYLKLTAREVGAPEDDPYANVSRFITMTVTLPGVSRPSIVLDRSMELETEQSIHFVQPTLIGGSNSTLKVMSEATLPSGQVIAMEDDTTVPFTPTVDHLESGKLRFSYKAWVEGYKEETLTTQLRFAYGWEYAWPEWVIDANKTEAEAPARLRFTVNQQRFAESYQSLGGEPITVQWNTSGGEVAYQYDKRFDVLYPQPGTFVTSATITDTRGNSSTVELPGVELLEGPPLTIDLIAGNSLSDWVSPTFIQANTVTQAISAYDKIKSYTYYLNGVEQGELPSSKRVNVMVSDEGTHKLKVRAITNNGEIAEQTVTFETQQNVPPSCDLQFESEGDSYDKFMVICHDSDSYIDTFEWTVDGEAISGSSYWIGMDSTLATEVQNISVKVTDTKGGVTIREWTR